MVGEVPVAMAAAPDLLHEQHTLHPATHCSRRSPTPSPKFSPMADTAARRYSPQSMTRPSRPRRWRGLAATLVVIGAVSCSDDPTAEERVCDARTELREAVDDVVTDVQAANFGEASDGTAAVSEAYNELVVALDDLGQEQRQALAPRVEGLAADIEALPDAQGLDELGSSLDAILSEVQQIYDETTEALQCE